MEKIIIDGKLFCCEPGTADKLKALVKKGDNAGYGAHMKKTAYQEYNDAIEQILLNGNGEHVDAIFFSGY